MISKIKLNWNNVLEQALSTLIGGLILALVLAIIGYFYQVFTGKIKISPGSFVKYLESKIILIFRWIVRNWHLIAGLIILMGVSYVYFVRIRSLLVLVTMFGLALSVILLTYYILKRIGHKKIWFGPYKPIELFSSVKTGKFSYTGTEPWTDPVECNPLFRDWPTIPSAKWVWIKDRPSDEEAQKGQIVYHKITFSLSLRPGQISAANLVIAVDDVVVIKINSQSIHRVLVGDGVVVLPITKCLCEGDNTVEMEIQNLPMPGRTGLDNPSGIIYHFEIR